MVKNEGKLLAEKFAEKADERVIRYLKEGDLLVIADADRIYDKIIDNLEFASGCGSFSNEFYFINSKQEEAMKAVGMLTENGFDSEVNSVEVICDDEGNSITSISIKTNFSKFSKIKSKKVAVCGRCVRAESVI